MSEILKKIERGFMMPCGPMGISADAVCKRSLREKYDKLLDRLTKEVNPNPVNSRKLRGGLEPSDNGMIVEPPKESLKEKKERLIQEGKDKADIQEEIRKYKENLQGNGKMLQDISGELQTF